MVWEPLEYVGEALVTIGVVGEVFAEWREPENKKLARASGLVVIAGLGLSLAALTGTNEYFNGTIADLNFKSSQANERASTAEADAATTKAANLKLGIELAEQEQRAADAEQEVARLNGLLADRHLTDSQVELIAGKLSRYSGQQYTVTAYWDSKESLGMANRIHTALQLAKWSFSPEGSKSQMLGGVIGVFVWTHPNADEATLGAADSLVKALNAEGIESARHEQNPNNPKSNTIGIDVGAKR
jgi:hypothetical protein